MTTALLNLKNNIEQFDWLKELENIIDSNKDAITELQAEQMAYGIDRNNEKVTLEGRGYSKYTYDYKTKYGKGLGAITDRITGYMTGDLYANLQVIREAKEFKIISTVEYFTDLLERVGPTWMGLNNEQKEKFAKGITLPEIRQIHYQKTKLTIS